MTILLYNHFELEERASKNLRAWKAWHLVLFALAAICGLVNFVFLQKTMELVDDNCVLFPRELEFHMVELPEYQEAIDRLKLAQTVVNNTDNAQDNAQNLNGTHVTKREVKDFMSNDGNMTVVTGNKTHRLMLDTSRTLFENDSTCQFAEFMPIMSTIFALVWITLFTMCPGGGRPRAGLQRPWTILMPALLFSLVMVGLTGHNFTITNKGLHAFCEDFFEVTNSTTCSSVNPFLERGWNASWGMGGRVGATRAAAAGVLATWACAAALLLARCLAGPDFIIKRTGVYVAKDPHQKIARVLKSPRSSHRSTHSSPTKRDAMSVRSEPTATTELVSASVEPGPDSAPSSLMTTPVKIPRNTDAIEMSYSPQERSSRV